MLKDSWTLSTKSEGYLGIFDSVGSNFRTGNTLWQVRMQLKTQFRGNSRGSPESHQVLHSLESGLCEVIRFNVFSTTKSCFVLPWERIAGAYQCHTYRSHKYHSLLREVGIMYAHVSCQYHFVVCQSTLRMHRSEGPNPIEWKAVVFDRCLESLLSIPYVYVTQLRYIGKGMKWLTCHANCCRVIIRINPEGQWKSDNDLLLDCDSRPKRWKA